MIEKKEWILIISLVALAFVLGMLLEQKIFTKKYNFLLQEMEDEVKNSIKKFSFGTVAYNPKPINETLNEPFVCIIGDNSTVEKIFSDVFLPAMEGNPVCFVNEDYYKEE